MPKTDDKTISDENAAIEQKLECAVEQRNFDIPFNMRVALETELRAAGFDPDDFEDRVVGFEELYGMTPGDYRRRLKLEYTEAAEDTRRFFDYRHLPPHLQEVSKRFAELAEYLAQLPPTRQRVRALDKLLEAKDAAVRSVLKP